MCKECVVMNVHSRSVNLHYIHRKSRIHFHLTIINPNTNVCIYLKLYIVPRWIRCAINVIVLIRVMLIYVLYLGRGERIILNHLLACIAIIKHYMMILNNDIMNILINYRFIEFIRIPTFTIFHFWSYIYQVCI